MGTFDDLFKDRRGDVGGEPKPPTTGGEHFGDLFAREPEPVDPIKDPVSIDPNALDLGLGIDTGISGSTPEALFIEPTRELSSIRTELSQPKGSPYKQSIVDEEATKQASKDAYDLWAEAKTPQDLKLRKSIIEENQSKFARDLKTGALSSVGGVVRGFEWIAPEALETPFKDFADNMETQANLLAVENPTFFDSLVQGIGSSAPFFVPGIGVVRGASILGASGKVSSLLGVSVSTGLEATAEAGGVYQDLINQGKSKEEANLSASNTFWANMLLVGLTNKVGPFSDNIKSRLLRQAVTTQGEGFQEYIQNGLANIETGKDFNDGGAMAYAIGALIGVPMEIITASDSNPTILREEIERIYGEAGVGAPQADLSRFGITDIAKTDVQEQPVARGEEITDDTDFESGIAEVLDTGKIETKKELAEITQEDQGFIYHGTPVDPAQIIEQGFKFGYNSNFGTAGFFTDSSNISDIHGDKVLKIPITDLKLKSFPTVAGEQAYIKELNAENLADAVKKDGLDGFIVPNPDPNVGTTYGIVNKEKLDSLLRGEKVVEKPKEVKPSKKVAVKKEVPKKIEEAKIGDDIKKKRELVSDREDTKGISVSAKKEAKKVPEVSPVSLEREFDALSKKGDLAMKKFFKKHPTQEKTESFSSASSFLTADEVNRMAELASKIDKKSFAKRGIKSKEDIKNIVKTKREIRKLGAKPKDNASLSELTSQLDRVKDEITKKDKVVAKKVEEKKVKKEVKPAKAKPIKQKTPVQIKYKKNGTVVFPKQEIKSPADVAFAFKELRNEAVEKFYTVGLKNGKPIAVELISVGTLNASLVHPREAMRVLVKKGADEAYFVHNHPSGNIQPSEADFGVMGRLKGIGEQLNIKFSGGIIIDTEKFSHFTEDEKVKKLKHIGASKTPKDVNVYKAYIDWTTKDHKVKIKKASDVYELSKGVNLDDGKNVLVGFLDTKNEVIATEIFPLDGLESSDIFKKALEFPTAGVIIASKRMDNAGLPAKMNKKFEDFGISLIDILEVNQKDDTYSSVFDKGEAGEYKKETGKITGEEALKAQLKPETRGQAFRRTFQDANARLDNMQKQLEAQGGRITEESDVFLAKTLLPRKIGAKTVAFEKKIIMPFVKKTIKLKVDINKLDEYLLAKHAPERNALMAEKGYKGEAGSGMTDSQSKKIIEEARKSGDIKKYEALAKDLTNINNMVLDYQVKTGLLKQEEKELMQKTYKHYVPLRREMDTQSGIGVGQGTDIRGKEIKRAKGSERKVLPITAQILHNMERAIVRSEKNQVGLAFKKLVEDNKIDSLWEVKPQLYRPQYNKDGELMFLAPNVELKSNQIGVKQDGKQYFIEIHDEKVVQALKNTGMTHGIASIRPLISYLSQITTKYSPEFLARNFQRDFFEGLINIGAVKDINLTKEQSSKLRREIAKNTPKLVKAVYSDLRGGKTKWSEVIKDFRNSGGEVGHFWVKGEKDKHADLEKLQRVLGGVGVEKYINKLRDAGDFVSDLNTAVELGIRISTYNSLTTRGLSKKRSAEIAGDLTVDFNKKGEAGPMLQSLYLFINPAIQGTAKAFRGVTTSKTVRKTAVAMVMGGFMNGIVSQMLGGDDDEDIPQYRKNTKVVFATPGGKEVSIFFLPYGFNTFWSFGRSLSELAMGQIEIKDVVSKTILAGLDSFNPVGGSRLSATEFVPSAFKPLVEIQENEAWYEAPIHPKQSPYQPMVPDSQLYYKSVRPTSKKMTDWLNRVTGGDEKISGKIDISPENLDYAFDQYTGGVGKFLLNSWETSEALIKGDKVKTENVPFLRDYYRETNVQASRTGIVYDFLDESDRTIFDEKEKQKFYDSVDKVVETEKYDEEWANDRKIDFLKAQYDFTLGRDKERLREAKEAIKEMTDIDRKIFFDNLTKDQRKRYMQN